MTKSILNDYLNRLPLNIGLLGMNSQDMLDYNHPTMAKVARFLENYNNQGESAQDKLIREGNKNSNYLNNWNTNKVQGYVNDNFNGVAQQAAMNIAQSLPQPPKPKTDLQNTVDSANTGNFQQAIQSSKAMPDFTPLPKQITAEEIQRKYNNNDAWTPEEQKSLDIYSQTQRGAIESPYKEGSRAYIINNLMEHGYNPQQIASYLEIEDRGKQKQQEVTAESLLQNNPYYNHLRDLASYMNPKQEEAIKELGNLYGQAQQQALTLNNTERQRSLQGKVTESDLFKLQTEIELQKLKNEAEVTKGNTGKILNSTQLNDINSLSDSINSLNQIKNIYSQPDKANLFGMGGLAQRTWNDTAGLHSNAEINNFNQDVNIARQIIGKEIEKGRMSDSDRIFYQKTLFNPNATQTDFINALDRYVSEQKAKHNTRLQSFSNAGYDVSNFSGYGQQPQQLQFNTEQEAINANLPKGTVITINGRKAVIE